MILLINQNKTMILLRNKCHGVFTRTRLNLTEQEIEYGYEM